MPARLEVAPSLVHAIACAGRRMLWLCSGCTAVAAMNRETARQTRRDPRGMTFMFAITCLREDERRRQASRWTNGTGGRRASCWCETVVRGAWSVCAGAKIQLSNGVVYARAVQARCGTRTEGAFKAYTESGFKRTQTTKQSPRPQRDKSDARRTAQSSSAD
jgi:hypothetical protein